MSERAIEEAGQSAAISWNVAGTTVWRCGPPSEAEAAVRSERPPAALLGSDAHPWFLAAMTGELSVVGPVHQCLAASRMLATAIVLPSTVAAATMVQTPQGCPPELLEHRRDQMLWLAYGLHCLPDGQRRLLVDQLFDESAVPEALGEFVSAIADWATGTHARGPEDRPPA
jgi:hypothetical protein